MNRIITEKKISWWIVLVVFASSFLSQNINLAILIVVFLYMFYLNHLKLSLNFPGLIVYILLMISGATAGIIYINQYGHSQYVYFKHIYYCSMIPLYWYIGYLIVKVNKLSHRCIINSLAISSILYSLYDIFRFFTTFSSINALRLYDYRVAVGGGSFIPILGLYLLVFYGKDLKYSKWQTSLFCIITLFVSIVRFSRVFIIELIILVLFSGFRFNKKKIFRVFLLFFGGMFLLYLFVPQMTMNFVEKILRSSTEIDFWKTVWTHNDIVNNWRGYEVYCALEQFKFSGTIKQLFGSGFGTFIDVNGYAYLVTDEPNLSMLHNGYFTHLIVWGIFGIVLYIFWGVQLFNYGKRVCNKQDGYLIKGIVMVLLVVTCFIKGPFFAKEIAMYIFYISLLYSFYEVEKNCSYSFQNNKKKSVVKR